MPEKRWPVSPVETRQLQERLRGRVVTKDKLGAVHNAAGVDAHYCAGNVWAAVVVISLSNLATVGSALVHRRLTFPYVPGLLSIREAPAIVEVLHQLSLSPDLLLVDGRGLAHPRRFGLRATWVCSPYTDNRGGQVASRRHVRGTEHRAWCLVTAHR
jgi:deoxyribonuclease V